MLLRWQESSLALPDTTVICSGKGLYLLTDDTCKTFFSLGHSIKIYFSFSRRDDSFNITVVLSWHLSALAILVLN